MTALPGSGATVLLAAALALLLAVTYGPVSWWALRLAGTGRGRGVLSRPLAGPAAEGGIHLAAAAVLVLAVLAAGAGGHHVLAALGASFGRDLGQPLLSVGAVAAGAVAVGAAEVGLAALAASVLLAAWGGGQPASGWLSLPRSGWARRWPRPAGAAPVTAVLILLAGVAAEEIVFRGLLLTALRPFGAGWAVGLSAAAYVAYGLTRPDARDCRADAACCCAVLGVVNGALFVAVPALWPLILAQLAFYLVLS